MMVGWWTPLILVAAALALGWGWTMVYRPLLQVRRLVRDLAQGKRSSGFVARGALGLETIIVDLEKVAHRLHGVSTQAERGVFSLLALLAGLSVGVMVSDRVGNIRLANQSFLKMFDLEEVPLGRTIMEAVRTPEIAEEASLTVQGRQGRNLEIQRNPVGGDGVRTLAVNFAPILDGRGEQAGVVTVFYDLSKIRRLETVRQEFMTNLSHELRTPLSILSGYLETVEDLSTLQGPDGPEILKVLRRNCDRLGMLVKDLLELSRIESGRIVLQRQPRNPREILQEVREDWIKAFAKKKVQLEIQCEDKSPEVSSDPLRTGQIFSNLMDNALRFAPPGSRVTIGARPSGAQVEFFVQDEGEGIPADKLERVFERFFRVDPGRTREKGGTGLGLSIVKHLAHLHGGTVRAESIQGKGTTIFFTINAK